MERWLKHKEYIHLAEAPDGADLPWGGRLNYPSGLNPNDSKSIELIAELYDELLPHFSSKRFNVGCDETFDLGQGKSKAICEKEGVGNVYLGFLIKIYNEVRKHDRTMMFWGDIILNHPELIGKLPDDIIALEWGYEANHPFMEHCTKFAEAGKPFWVCPGTSSWNSLGGRTNNCIGNLLSAAKNGFALGADGYLITDWGDNGHWQYLPVSYLGFLYGAAVSWNTDAFHKDIIIEALSKYAFGDANGKAGKAFYDLGNAYEEISVKPNNCTTIWRQLNFPIYDLKSVDNITKDEFQRTKSIIESAITIMQDAVLMIDDATLVKNEFVNNAAMMRLACDIGLLKLKITAGEDVSAERIPLCIRLEEIIEEHKRLWLSRNRKGGLVDSVRRFELKLDELRA